MSGGLQGSNLARLQSIVYNLHSQPMFLEVGCLEEQYQPGNLLEGQIPESETLGVGLAICV